MTIKIDDIMPSVDVQVFGEKGPQGVSTDELFAGKKVVMFAVPGAFTPGCSLTHLPGFVVKADEIKAKGVDSIICTSVNDAFVMHEWGKAQNAEEIIMLADGNGALANALGLSKDASGYGMGIRSCRYAMIVEDKVVKVVNIDEKGIDKSSAETILGLL